MTPGRGDLGPQLAVGAGFVVLTVVAATWLTIDHSPLARAAEAGHPDPVSWTGLTFYPLHLGPQLGFVVAVLFVGGLAVALRGQRWLLPLAVGGVRVPDALVDWVVRHYDPSARLASRIPFVVEIGAVRIGDGAVRLSGGG